MVMAPKPLLSIIIPVYNGSAYIDALLERFAKQNMDETELVFIDDGSTDDSYAKLLKWQKNTGFAVTVYHQENKGVSAARNTGVNRAKGAYLTFVDVDDGIAPNYITALFEYIRKDVDVLVFNSKRIKEGDEELGCETAAVNCQSMTKQEMLVEFLEDPTRFGVYDLLIRAELVRTHAITFPVGYKYYEDYDYLLQLLAQADKLMRLDQILYYYILREGSAMGRFNADRINCLQLMKRRGEWLWEAAPEFAPLFEKWGTSRLYWSVLWQAALALPTYGEFAEFAKMTHARHYLTKLKGYPDKLLQLSTGVFLFCKPAYYVAVRMVGRAKSKVSPIALKDIQADLLGDVAFY